MELYLIGVVVAILIFATQFFMKNEDESMVALGLFPVVVISLLSWFAVLVAGLLFISYRLADYINNK